MYGSSLRGEVCLIGIAEPKQVMQAKVHLWRKDAKAQSRIFGKASIIWFAPERPTSAQLRTFLVRDDTTATRSIIFGPLLLW